MRGSRADVERVARVVGYIALGFVGTALTALLALPLTHGVQSPIYHLLYLEVGPSAATQTAILTHFLAAGFLAIAVPTVVGDYLSDGLAHRRAIGVLLAALLAHVVLFLVVGVAGLGVYPVGFLVLALGVIAGGLLLRYRYGVRSGGLLAFGGGVPVLFALLLLAGFGLGWGWGYVMTAQEVPESSVEGTAADFAEVPAVSEDLFGSYDCETDPDGRRVCRLHLRGYEHERTAARFMDRHGVRCPYQGAGSSDRRDSFVAEHEGTYYRVTCDPHGD